MWNRCKFLILIFLLSGCASFVKDELPPQGSEKTSLNNLNIDVQDYAGSTISEIRRVSNEDDKNLIIEHVKRNYEINRVTFGGNNDNKDKILVLKFTQVSSNYDSFPHKLWMIGMGLTLGLVPFHSNVTITVEGTFLGKNGKLLKNYKSQVDYDFWVHLFLTPYLFNEHNDKYGRIALRNYLFDKVITNAKNDSIL